MSTTLALLRNTSCPSLLCLIACLGTWDASAAEVIPITAENWGQIVPAGKEADWIYGDYVLRNEQLIAVVAQPIEGRNANMTVRDVSGALIDLTFRSAPADQLSCFYPGGAAVPLRKARVASSSSVAQLICSSLPRAGMPTVDVHYQLADGDAHLTVTSRFTNPHSEAIEFELQDAVRADRDFQHGIDPSLQLYWCHDLWWKQAYGVLAADHKISAVADTLQRQRPVLAYTRTEQTSIQLQPGRTYELKRFVFPAPHSVGVKATARQLLSRPQRDFQLHVLDAGGDVPEATVTVSSGDDVVGRGLTDEQGRFAGSLPDGDYRVQVGALGRGEQSAALQLDVDAPQVVSLPSPALVVAEIRDKQGRPIPAKVQFRGRDVEDPNFGPDTKSHGVGNLRYTASGDFRTAIGPGNYDVIVSRGPEYDAVFQTITAKRGETTRVAARLRRSVDTSGWVSSDFHSHSTPSGDNTSSQLGRVLNLLAEHIEFAPCTEHNRISTYSPHLQALRAEPWMATCSGMELTGKPLPINHQNAFPLEYHPHTQDGGGPRTDENPILQIERLALWDNGSDKLVQENHPNLEQIWADRDLDGSQDDGFAQMFGYMDVIEVHPPRDIFTSRGAPTGNYRNVIVSWLRMLNKGFRIPGVVNTDAHYNFHGSGWLRNYIKSSTDDPAEIETMEMVHQAEQGHVIMTNGPFLEVHGEAGSAKALPGDDLTATDGQVTLHVRVQCPNWLDVNRVQVFVNGRPAPEWNFTRREHADKFGTGVVKFDEAITVTLREDAHLIVATIGEGLKLGPVMGPTHGEDVPVALSNPIFVNVDGDRFEPNHDLLDLPFPFKAE